MHCRFFHGKEDVFIFELEGCQRDHADIGMVLWPSGLRRWFQAPVISMAWVRIPPLPFMREVLKLEIE